MTLQQLAGRLGVSKQAVSKYLSGKSAPRDESIHTMADVFGVPVSYFNKASMPLTQPSSALFFRKTASTPQKKIDYAAVVCRWCYEVLRGLEEFGDSFRANIPVLNDAQGAIGKAKALREHWGLGTSPIEDLTRALEDNGIIVSAVSDAELSVDAYSQMIDGVPIIVLNKDKGSAVRQRFSLAHELGHLVLHGDMSEAEFIMRRREAEGEAQLFANSFLLSPEGFDDTVVADAWEQFLDHKRKWKVSIAAMMHHRIDTDTQNSEMIEKERLKFIRLFGRKAEPLDDAIPKEAPSYILGRIGRHMTDDGFFDRFYAGVRLPADYMEMIAGLPKNLFEEHKEEDHGGGEPHKPYEQMAFIWT
jgi:Zn-dependent peptidase ImmA (M78 family)/DNA-binding XRE family transcriptional regulator